MTSPISSYSQTQDLTVSTSPAGPKLPGKPQAAASAGPAAQSPVEAVTLTAGAHASAALLDAARSAGGVDHNSVQSLRAAIASGSYHVPADKLASAIVAGLSTVKR
ncbi:MAG: flagellar biosynthesis anti-sigma factor FlgM [Proteobacteria bacterium]|nr:flagellar biosynthesis anti-sigma factor FlgM [Pseudomonadota bacterium]